MEISYIDINEFVLLLIKMIICIYLYTYYICMQEHTFLYILYTKKILTENLLTVKRNKRIYDVLVRVGENN